MNLIEDQVVLHGRRLNMRHEGVGLKSTLAFHRRVANEIEREVTHDGEVVRVMLGSRTHLIIGKNDIPAPVKTGLNRPVLLIIHYFDSASTVRSEIC